jgi:hypothetical protein
MYDVECDRLKGILSQALAIVDTAARACGLSEDPASAIGLLREDEQRWLYALLKGD